MNKHEDLSIGIGSCPIDTIGDTFYPLIQHGKLFRSLPRIVMTFPSESVRVRWIQWIPSERLYTLLSKIGELFPSLPRDTNAKETKKPEKCENISVCIRKNIANANHITSNGNNIKWNHFEILASERSDTHCRIIDL